MSRTRRRAPASLVVGVTGHRDVSVDDPGLRQVVLEQLARLRRAFPGRPLLVLSSLAEGADRLVARLAIDCHEAKLVAPLPMSPEEYAKDFAAEASKREFWRLLREADQWLELPADEPAGQAAASHGARARRYARAGAYIVEHCAVLIALWDGLPSRGAGGTADLVEWKAQGRVPPELSSTPDGPRAPARDDPDLVVQINPDTYEVTHIPSRRL